MIDLNPVMPHPNGKKIIIATAIATLFALFFLPNIIALSLFIITLWCVWFFRDPERITPIANGRIISPADGRVSAIETILTPPEVDIEMGEMIRISIFMNIFDVHVNRAPIGGKIRDITYIEGKFINASLDKSHHLNERQAMTFETETGVKIATVQIAGLIARRIDRFVEVGDNIQAGTRIGMIRFGSRVDVYMPSDINPLIEVGQRMIAGETVLADMKHNPPRATFKPS